MSDPGAQSGASRAAGIETIEKLQLALMQGSGFGRRGQHFKPHGCVWARFEVLKDIPARYKVGIFATPAKYTAYIRFSNGGQPDDTQPDIHGMAIKLTGVPGAKILAAEQSAATHDFILADHPVFFIRNVEDYVRFMTDFARTAPRGEPPLEFFEWLKQNRPRDLQVVKEFRQQVQSSPLAAEYWSQVPFAFGLGDGTICRYGAKPQPGNLAEPLAVAALDAGYLRRAMLNQLSRSRLPARFDFTVQLRDAASAQVIDDPTAVWDTEVQRVALITIPPQSFDTPEQDRFGEDLAYTPWHALPEHRPVGEINEVRKAVYFASSKLRHETNGRPALEPSGTEHLGFGLRLSQEELTAQIDADFKQVVERLQKTFNMLAHDVKHGRATHTYGVAARGEARCIVPADFPPNDVFVLGKIYPIILRHSSPGAREDDRARDGVAASIKFFEPGSEDIGPGFFDLLMNAGRQLFVRCIRDFSTFVHTPDPERIKLVQQGVMLEDQLREAYRIRGSFTESRYHSWVCFEFTDNAGVLRYVRFRLIHQDRGPDRNLPDAGFRANGRPSMEPVEGDPRAPDFLRQDFIYKVQHSDVRYILQAQLRDAPDPVVVNHELFDPSQPWNEHWFPCVDLFEIRLREVVEDEPALSRLEMNPNRSPRCIRIPLATSPDHYASLGHARAIIYPGARAARASVPHPQNN